MPVLERLDVVVQLAIVAHGVRFAVLVREYRAQSTLLDQFASPRLQVWRIAAEISERGQSRLSTGTSTLALAQSSIALVTRSGSIGLTK